MSQKAKISHHDSAERRKYFGTSMILQNDSDELALFWVLLSVQWYYVGIGTIFAIPEQTGSWWKLSLSQTVKLSGEKHKKIKSLNGSIITLVRYL